MWMPALRVNAIYLFVEQRDNGSNKKRQNTLYEFCDRAEEVDSGSAHLATLTNSGTEHSLLNYG